MTNVLIAYCSRHGTTRKAGELIAAAWAEAAFTYCDLGAQALPDLVPFDAVILGGSVHGGFVQYEVRREAAMRQALLSEKVTGLYMCFMDNVHAEANFERAYPEALRHQAAALGLFGGELMFEKMNWLDRLIVTRFTTYKENVSHLRMDAIERFATAMKQAVRQAVAV